MNICEGNSLVKMTGRQNRHSLCLHRKGWKNLLFVFDQWTWKYRRENILCKPNKNIFVGSENHLFFFQNRKKDIFKLFLQHFSFFPSRKFCKIELKFLHILSCSSINKIITKLTTNPYVVIARVWKSPQHRRAMQFVSGAGSLSCSTVLPLKSSPPPPEQSQLREAVSLVGEVPCTNHRSV